MLIDAQKDVYDTLVIEGVKGVHTLNFSECSELDDWVLMKSLMSSKYTEREEEQ